MYAWGPCNYVKKEKSKRLRANFILATLKYTETAPMRERERDRKREKEEKREILDGWRNRTRR